MSIFKSQTRELRDDPGKTPRRVMTISRKKWGKSAAKTERVIRDAVPKEEVLDEINEYLKNAKSVTRFDLANKFGIRASVAKRILKEHEHEGRLIPYIRESGFVVYTTPEEMEKRERGVPIMTQDVLEEVAASTPKESVIDEEMEAALAAASSVGPVKPSKLARKRREAGEKKERKDVRPEVVVEPLEEEPTPEPEKEPKKEPEKEPKKEPKKEPEKEPVKKMEKPTLQDIDGIGPKTAEGLKAAGAPTVYRLSTKDPEELSEKVDGLGLKTAEKIIETADKLWTKYKNQ